MKTMTVAVVGALLAVSASAGDTWVWTGAEDAYWTNAANWTVNEAVATTPPGVCLDAGGGKVGAQDATAAFGTMSGVEALTIDVDGLYDIHTLVVSAGAATKYTFGASADQSFTLHATGGVFRVEAGAKAPVVAAQFGVLGYAPPAKVSDWNANATAAGAYNADFADNAPVIENNSSEALDLQRFFLSHANNYVSHMTVFKGTGDVLISGMATTGNKTDYNIIALQQSGGKVTIGFSPGNNRVRNVYSHKGYAGRLEIAKGCVLPVYAGNDFFKVGRAGKALTVFGEGTVLCRASKKTAANGGGYMNPALLTPTGSSAVFTCKLLSEEYENGAFYGNILIQNYQGDFSLLATNELRGFVQILATEPETCHVKALGCGDVPGGLGYGGVQLAGGGKLAYEGPGEVTDRTLYITNQTPNGTGSAPASRMPKGTLTQAGTGALVWNGPIAAPGVAGATITLANATANDLTVGYPIGDDMAVAKTGSGVVRLAAACTYTGTTTVSAGTLAIGPGGSIANTSEITISGNATLTFEGDGTERTAVLPPFVNTSGNTTIRAQFGTSLEIPSLTYTAGSVNVIPSGGSEVKITDPALVGTAPSWLKYAGLPAKVDADGSVVPTSLQNVIAARGDVVPDKPGEPVTVFKKGTGEADTLEKDAVSMQSLDMYAGVKATVEIGEGQSLAAERVVVMDGALPVQLGTVAGQGEVKAVGEQLDLRNESTFGAIDVRAKLSAKRAVSSTVTESILSGGAAGLDLRVPRGTVRVTGEERFVFDRFLVGTNMTSAVTPTPTLVFDGAKDVRLLTNDHVFAVGEHYEGDPYLTGQPAGSASSWTIAEKTVVRMVVTNSTIVQDCPSTDVFEKQNCHDAICVGHTGRGILEIQEGAVVMSRVTVGCGSFNNTKTPLGAVYQTGGELAVWGYSSKSSPGFSVGLRGGYGYFGLEGGLLTVPENKGGTIGQYGIGAFVQTGGTLDFGSGPLGLNRENGGHALGVFSGGTTTVGEVTMCEASSGGYSQLLVEGDAYVECTSVMGGQSVNNPAVIDASLNLNGGVFETAGIQRGTAVSTQSCFSVGFNGGVFRCTKHKVDPFWYNYGYTTTAHPTNMLVYAGGAIIDTGTNDVFTAASFKAPTTGVLGVDFKADSTEYLGMPIVRIIGDGAGAAAVAVWDKATRRVTGIRVTAAGTGYSTATAYVIYTTSNRSYATKYACSVGPVASGGFVKRGAGSLELSGDNTYTGDTVVEEGTLVLASATALPPASALVFRGGTVVANDAVYFPSSVTVDFTPEKDSRVALASFPNGAPETTPTLIGLAPDEWRLRLVGTTLKLAPVSGAMLIVR